MIRAQRLWKLAAGLAVLLLGTLTVSIWYRGGSTVGDCADCQEIYQLILRPSRNDHDWNKTHVLLGRTDDFRSIASTVSAMRSRLPWFERLKYSFELESFLAQKGDQPLVDSVANNLGLRLIAPNERNETLKQGIIILTFTLPGFSFDRRRAMVFLIAERQYPGAAAPIYRGSLIYLKKAGSQWIIDHPRGLPEFDVVS